MFNVITTTFFFAKNQMNSDHRAKYLPQSIRKLGKILGIRSKTEKNIIISCIFKGGFDEGGQY